MSTRLFTSLCAQIDGGHFTNAIKTCDKILRLNPNDADAHKTKLFLLLQTEQYDDALDLLTEENKFEHAYALYRLHREQEATALLDQVSPHRGVLHLRAQMSYRTGSYSQAVSLYTRLLESADLNSDEHTDIQTNLHASQLHLDFTSTGYLHALDALPASSSIESTAPPPIKLPSSSVPLNVHHNDTEKRTKTPRKSRVPKGVVPGVTPPPDPERWIKKSERSGAGAGAVRRRRGAGASAGVGGATQGSVSVSVEAVSAPGAGAKGKNKGKGRK